MLRWTPDGRFLAGMTRNEGLSRGQTLNLFHPELGGEPVPLADTLRFGADWAPDGGALVYMSNGCAWKEFDLYTIKADGTGKRRLTNSPQEYKNFPRWSPTGDVIAYATQGEIRLMDVATGKEQKVVTGTRQRLREWSPDGRYLTFSALEFGLTCKEM